MGWMTKPRDPHFAPALQTERFDLRPLSLWQAWSIGRREWLDDPEVAGAVTGGELRGSQWRLLRLMTRPNGRTKFIYGIYPRDRPDAPPIGVETFRIYNYRTASLAVLIHDRDWWGKGVVHEVRRALISHILASPRVERIHGVVESRNFASIFNYQKLGFTHVGTTHRSSWSTLHQAPADMLTFEMLQENWPAEDSQ